MFFNSDHTSLPNLSITKPKSALNQSVDTEQDVFFQKQKEILNNSILWTIKELELSKRNYIINSAYKIKAKNEILVIDSAIMIDSSNYTTDDSLMLELIEKLENNENKSFNLKKDLSKFNVLLKSRLSWVSYSKLKKLEQKNKRKWNKIEYGYKEIVNSIKPNTEILIKLNSYASILYQNYLKKFDQIAKNYLKFSKYIEENKANDDNNIYLGFHSGIAVLIWPLKSKNIIIEMMIMMMI
ncbi:unnamed protein product [Blepharisma stoltei]|uniref:Uncharacterized protein n=1 Tax=Blepharisma stoltei TaxID=1481888 RepID=A0AAU9KDN3_9CILI|nr:unnamed protein product [Blepharisma stoltei]